MNGIQLITALKKKLGTTSNKNLCRVLDVAPMTLQNWQNNKHVTPLIVAGIVSRLTKKKLTGEAVIEAARKKLASPSLRKLASELGITDQYIQIWKNRPSVTALQIAGLIANTKTAVKRKTHASSIRPIVEFFPITKTSSKQKKKFEIFADSMEKEQHPYLAGLKAELASHHGVYVFFDSRGQAIYAGKARKQNLWKELNLAFNRERGALQKIRRVMHPSQRRKYLTSEEKSRQITECSVALHDLASYFSAYDVADGMVDALEALLVRSFANDLLNKRMEKFGRPNTQ